MPATRQALRTLLILLAVGCAGWVAVTMLQMHLAQKQLRRELAEALGHQSRLGDFGPALSDTVEQRLPHGFGDLVGRIEIPRIGLDVMVLEGVRERFLDEGAGHFPETPLPGFGGNAAFAGHRDTFFRKLRHVVDGDTVLVTTPWGLYSYTVSSIQIVEPEDVWVLDQRGDEMLTLITCYPFDWIGPAPRRVVVMAVPVTSSRAPSGDASSGAGK